MSRTLLSAINNFEISKSELLSELRSAGNKTTADAILRNMTIVDSELKAVRYIATHPNLPIEGVRDLSEKDSHAEMLGDVNITDEQLLKMIVD